MPATIAVLGAGLIGRAIALDLAEATAVTVYDLDAKRLAAFAGTNVTSKQADLSQRAEVALAVENADLVILALPGFMGFSALASIIDLGKSVVDISFFPEDALTLDALAKKRGVTAIVDCGVAPGFSNFILGHAIASFDSVERFTCYVGGLPQERTLPFEYKAPFSPIDVIEEYTRPARFRRNGENIETPALAEPEFLEFPGVGTLEAFLTDGLRTILRTTTVPNLEEKTLRYPGHREKIALLRDLGFLNETPLMVKGQSVAPRDLAARLLLPLWELRTGDEDITVLRGIIDGIREGQRIRRTISLHDGYDRPSGIHSMARTTGYFCTQVARAVLRGDIADKGIIPPEQLGQELHLWQPMLDGLAERGIAIHFQEQAR